MLNISADEKGLIINDYRGCLVTQIPLELGSGDEVVIEKYRRSNKVLVKGLKIWNVKDFVWCGEPENTPQIKKEIV